MVERWTRERRTEHTRTLLVDAAQEVFAAKGFGAASLDDIAAAAGYTRGAIYVHFKAKEDLFLAVHQRYWRRFFDTFTELLAAVTEIGEAELAEIAGRWRRLAENGGTQQAALGYEFTLYLLRNPEARARVVPQQQRVHDELTAFIVESLGKLGATLAMPASVFAQILIATSDSIMLAAELNNTDLYRPVLELYTAVITAP
ncbi:TetR/AcrR family transcriptional regulator [Nocardia carnea]|uniref:TetR/AcrR family transcriptional regulator n=1 Tax=Nocardia carnea TaxID=37328 RepID=UPI002456FD96|nr:TetR family transcriptional regulator [Nocardia carnea]